MQVGFRGAVSQFYSETSVNQTIPLVSDIIGEPVKATFPSTQVKWGSLFLIAAALYLGSKLLKGNYHAV